MCVSEKRRFRLGCLCVGIESLEATGYVEEEGKGYSLEFPEKHSLQLCCGEGFSIWQASWDARLEQPVCRSCTGGHLPRPSITAASTAPVPVLLLPPISLPPVCSRLGTGSTERCVCAEVVAVKISWEGEDIPSVCSKQCGSVCE